MKIAVFTRAYVTQGMGGVPSVCQSLCEGLVNEGQDVHLFTTGHSNPNMTEETLNGVTIHYTKSEPMRYTKEFYDGCYNKFKQIGGWDILFSESGAAMDWVNKVTNIPTFMRLHGVSIEETVNHLQLWYAQNRVPSEQDLNHYIVTEYKKYFTEIPLFRRFGTLVAISKESERVLRSRYYHPNVVRFYSGLDTEKWQCRNEKRELIFVSTGKIQERKGFDWVIKSFINANVANAKLYIIGNTTPIIPKYLDTLASGHSNIKFLGTKTHNELIDLYNKCWAFIDGSNHYTGMNTTCMEAGACGLPVICANFESMTELVDDGGLLVPLANVEKMGLAIREIAEKNTRDMLGVKMRTRVCDIFNRDKNIKRIISLFTKEREKFA